MKTVYVQDYLKDNGDPQFYHVDGRVGALIKLYEDTLLKGNIPSNSRVLALGANLTMEGQVGSEVEIHLDAPAVQNPGFLGRLFGKKAATPSMTRLVIHGNVGNFLKINAPATNKIEILGDVGKALEIHASKDCDIIMANTGSHLRMRHVSTLRALTIGDYARLHGIGYLDVDVLGDNAAVTAKALSIKHAGSDSHFIYCGEEHGPSNLPEGFVPFKIQRLGELSFITAPKIIVGRERQHLQTHYEQPVRQPFVPRVIPGGREPS